MLKKVTDYFEKYMSVGGANTKTFTGFSCAGETISGATNEAIDLFVTVKAEVNTSEGYFAAAQICATTTDDKRPLIGLFYMNFASMVENKITEEFYQAVFAHEFTHILGFSSGSFDEFRDAAGNKRAAGTVYKSKNNKF